MHSIHIASGGPFMFRPMISKTLKPCSSEMYVLLEDQVAIKLGSAKPLGQRNRGNGF